MKTQETIKKKARKKPRLALVNGEILPGKKLGPHYKAKNFYLSREWKILRYHTLVDRGRTCEACGATPKERRRIHIDHIKPVSKYPELALDPKNLQVLCDECNIGKGAWDETDFRTLN